MWLQKGFFILPLAMSDPLGRRCRCLGKFFGRLPGYGLELVRQWKCSGLEVNNVCTGHKNTEESEVEGKGGLSIMREEEVCRKSLLAQVRLSSVLSGFTGPGVHFYCFSEPPDKARPRGNLLAWDSGILRG